MLDNAPNGTSGNGGESVFPQYYWDPENFPAETAAGLGFKTSMSYASSLPALPNFGQNTVYHYLFNQEIGASPVSVFYKYDGFSHPSGGPEGRNYFLGALYSTMSAPNWIYYYDLAWKNPWGIPIIYINNRNSVYYDGDAHVFVGIESHGMREFTYLFGRKINNDGTKEILSEVGLESTRGIDTYARLIVHECIHKLCYDFIVGNPNSDMDRTPQGDVVGDGVPDVWETKVGLNPNILDTLDFVKEHEADFGDAAGDSAYTIEDGEAEVFARMHERNVLGPIELDWANDGLNYGWSTPPHRTRNRLSQVFNSGIQKGGANVEWPILPSGTDPNAQ